MFVNKIKPISYLIFFKYVVINITYLYLYSLSVMYSKLFKTDCNILLQKIGECIRSLRRTERNAT